MRFRNRSLARAGAAVLLAAGATTALSAPAYAAANETDLELTVVGTKVAANAEGKFGWAKITNKGEKTPGELTIAADVSALDFSKVFVAAIDGNCSTEGDAQPTKWICELAEDMIPGPGETVEVPVLTLKAQPGAAPYTAPVTFTISSPDDTDESNNSKTVDVSFSEESGVDLGVWVPDVKTKIDPATGEESSPLLAGDTTAVIGSVFNWGDMIANGVRITVQLPKQVTFAEEESDCKYSADNRTATCEYKTVVIPPASQADEDDDVAMFYWPITVGADVAAPVTLGEGSWTVEALGQSPAGELRARATGALPKNVEMVSLEETEVNEVDASDNVDGFAVVVAEDSSGGGGGGLPVTGVQAGVLGGIGVAVVVAGAVLFLVARRRRVVLVTPGDETSAS